MEFTMYETLLKLPYFQGMSKDDLTIILDKVKFKFVRHNNGEKVLNQSDVCDNIVILMRGELKVESTSPDNSYSLIEYIASPYAIEPYSLFGAKNRYRSNYFAHGECDTLSISKSYLFSEFSRHEIFFINLLNLVSQRTQNLNKSIWEHRAASLKGRIIQFIATRSEIPSGEKSLMIKMEKLANLLGETRINISRSLNDLQERKIINLQRKEIIIPSYEKLIAELDCCKEEDV